MKNFLLLFVCLTLLTRPIDAQDNSRGSASSLPSASPAQINFIPDFAPSERPTTPEERPYRDDTCLNGSWQFMPVAMDAHPNRQQLEEPALPSHPAWSVTPIRIPSPWNVNSFPGGHDGGDFITYPDYPAAWDTVKAGWLMRQIPYKRSWAGRRLILHFEAVAGFTRIFVNGAPVARHFDNFLPFDIDITDQIHPGKDNELLVWVAAARLFDKRGPYGRRPYVGGSFWGQHIAGIWQDVNLLVRPMAYISQTVVQSLVSRDSLRLLVTVRNSSPHPLPAHLSATIHPWVDEAGTGPTQAPEPRWRLAPTALTIQGPTLTLAPHADTTVSITAAVHGRLALWEPAHPNLYGLLVGLSPAGDRRRPAADSLSPDLAYTRFGWREATIHNKQFLLNGQPLILRGDSWHFMGIPQMTRRYAWAWYTMLKAAHANAVRLHAQPYPSFYLDVADEMGILVLDETAMWASDGGPDITSEDYWNSAATHLKDLIVRDRNHPSVFGWSVCNENIPVAVNVFHAPEQLVQRQLSEIDRWVSIARDMDPTRDWISGDGETGRPTILPTLIGHYGGETAYKQWSGDSILWGIGESGMAYYGTPRQTAAYNGDVSYTSQYGRMEGVAAEALHLVNLQKRYKAVYRSVFNLVWYGLQPLELGLADTTRAPLRSDGIFFHAFAEGQPGIQPERLGPYTTTLNPGYDPRLPLYRPWPLFTALAAAFGDSAIQPEPASPTANRSTIVTGQAASATPAVQGMPPVTPAVHLLSAPGSPLDTLLRNLGATLSDRSDHILIDGLQLPDPTTLAKALEESKSGSSLLIWGINPSTISRLNALLPAAITLTDRKATSFIPAKPSLGDNAGWYFSESSRQPVSEYGLTGDFVRNATVLLAACNTDWQKWNGRPEHSKTGAVIRSEREAKPAGNVLVEYSYGQGRIDILSIDPGSLYRVSRPAAQRVLSSWGIQLLDSAALHRRDSLSGGLHPALDAQGVLRQAELLTKNGGHPITDFDLTGPARIGFWLYSPRSLVNLLVEPDIPILTAAIGGTNNYKLSINDSQIHTGVLPLRKGWNHIVVDIRSRSTRPFSLQLSSDHPSFLSTLRSSAIAPDTELTPNDDAHE